ncbi:MAG TPA: hypothetical protein VE987_05135 [Polyangiaceae bacterium]|nr:hypothetical protein [Polyangiaceae bacterium]
MRPPPRDPSCGARRRLPDVAAAVAVAVLVLAAVFAKLTTLSVASATVRRGDAPPQQLALPILVDAPADAVLDVSFTVHKGRLTQRSVVIVPDDEVLSISVDGVDVPLAGVDPKALTDTTRGFRFPLGAHLRRGDSAVVVRVRNRSGPAGLDVKPDWRDWPAKLELGAAAGAAIVLVGAALRRSGWPWSIVSLYAAGLAARVMYLTQTPFSARSHDVDGHLAYIQYLLEHHALPPPYAGWQFYQPPLYYVLAALSWRAMTWLGVASRASILLLLQLESVVYQLGFLVFSALTAEMWIARIPDRGLGRRWSSRSGLLALHAALACLWVSGVLHSVRLGNDDLLYLLFGAGLYFASRWWLLLEDRDLTLAAACAAIGMSVKSNALVLFAVLGALLVARLLSDDRRDLRAHLRRALPAAGLFVLSVTVALGRAAVDTAHGRRPNVLVGNANRLTGDLLVGNRAENYLWFDLQTFVTHAFASSLHDEAGRQFFWNFALKTSLFGEFDFEGARAWNLAVVISVVFLLVLAYAAAATALAGRDEWLADLPALSTIALLVASLAALRMSIPMACSGDFRYILPVLTPALYLHVRGVARFRELGLTRLAGLGVAMGWSLCALSAAFVAAVVAEGP